MLEQEADRSGLSAAQFVREATILRLAMLAGMRGDDDAKATLASVADQARAPDKPRNGDDPVARAIADAGRLAALNRTGLLDSAPDERFDGLTRIAARVLHAPVAMVSLVDQDRQFFKSCFGLTREPWASDRARPRSPTRSASTRSRRDSRSWSTTRAKTPCCATTRRSATST